MWLVTVIKIERTCTTIFTMQTVITYMRIGLIYRPINRTICPLRWPDLTHLDFSLWGHLKDICKKKNQKQLKS